MPKNPYPHDNRDTLLLAIALCVVLTVLALSLA